jgi:HAD superfamily hydrolase (TIGR01458 family)
MSSPPARLKGVMLDLDGVVYLRDEMVPGSLQAVKRLREAGMALRFVTNTTRTPHAAIRAKLLDFGFAIAPEELITPAASARSMIERGGLDPHLLIHPALAEDFAGLSRGTREAVVVGDAGDGFTYEALNQAFRALERGAEFLALANNRAFRDGDGELSLDAGPFVQALAFAADREPMVLGKPAPAFFAEALAGLDCKAHEAAMVGDDVEADVGGAMAAGLTGVLVRTGKYQPGVEARIDPPPDAVCDDLAAAAEWLLAG